jgi:ribosomal protein S17E
MNFWQNLRKYSFLAVLIAMFSFTTACATVAPSRPKVDVPVSTSLSSKYGQLTRGSTAKGQNFGDWVVEASKGLVSDAFVRENNKLGVVISPQVRPNEVKDLAKSLTQGFHKSFPGQDLTVLMYAPDKKLIMTSLYDVQSKQIDFKVAG